MKMRQFLAALMVSFLLGIQDGYITLWKNGSAEPVEVFPYQVKYLPKADQARLEAGIVIDTNDQLARLMEDYLS